MRYWLEHCQCGNCDDAAGQLHVDVALPINVNCLDGSTVGSVRHGVLSDHESDFFEAVLGIPGVTGVATQTRYMMAVKRGLLFEWDAIIPQIAALIRDYYGTPGDTIAADPRKPKRGHKPSVPLQGIISGPAAARLSDLIANFGGGSIEPLDLEPDGPDAD